MACFRESLERFRKSAEEPASFGHEALSSCVVGCPGTGKTTAVTRILALYSQAIAHRGLRTYMPLLQIVHLRVACPREGNVKALCTLLIEEIGRLADLNYKEAYVRPRSSLEYLKTSVVRLMMIHSVGLLVLDDMQNNVRRGKKYDELFSFIVNLSNAVGLPVLLIGTPKFGRFMRNDGRFAALGSLSWDRLTPTVTRRNQTGEDEVQKEKPNPDWRRFIDGLWQASVLRGDGARMPGRWNAGSTNSPRASRTSW